jgi:hypothetical protein
MTQIRLFIGACLLAGIFVSTWAADALSSNGPVRHVVSFKFKETATPQQIQKVVDAFGELKAKIPVIVSFECGTNISPEKLNKGFTHCFILTFKSEKDRDLYLVHPAHKAFGEGLGPILGDVLVIDFAVKK